MKKRSKIILICISTVFIIASVVLSIMNYVVLPPKTSESAVKYKYYGDNFMFLKSITDDENYVIIEFSSLNKYFNKTYNRKNIKDQTSSTKGQKFVTWYGKLDPYSNMVCNPDYSIISTLTSNYLIIEKGPEMKTENLYMYYYVMEYQDVEIQLSFFEKYENATIYMSKKSHKKNDYDGTLYKEQKYNSYDRIWNPVEKSIRYDGPTIPNTD